MAERLWPGERFSVRSRREAEGVPRVRRSRATNFWQKRSVVGSHEGKDRLHTPICHIAVQLCDRLIGRMHGEDGNARIEGIDVALGHELGDRAAAARVGAAKLSHLPLDAVVVEDLANLADDLGGGIGRTALVKTLGWK